MRRRRRAVAAVAGCLLTLLWCAADILGGPARTTWPTREILNAIRWVESGDRPDARVPDGDDGLAIGPYQVHRVYWRDAVDFDPTLAGDYQDCRRGSYAERVIQAYMRRHAPDAWAAQGRRPEPGPPERWPSLTTFSRRCPRDPSTAPPDRLARARTHGACLLGFASC